MRARCARTVDSGKVREALRVLARLHLRLARFHAAFASGRGRDSAYHQTRSGHLTAAERRFGSIRGFAIRMRRRGIRKRARRGHRGGTNARVKTAAGVTREEARAG
jgi:hypothetical protein